MVALLGLLLPLVFTITAQAIPAAPLAQPPTSQSLKFPNIPPGLLCKLPIIGNVFCAVKRNASRTVKTPIGTAHGVVNGQATRYVVKYGSAARWGPPQVATTWALPNNLTDPTGSPLACPQDNIDSSTYSEDCLSLILYVPNTVSSGPQGNVPTIMWLHGGSFMYGSATGPGLDGSKLAVATNSIVAVVQYRLGGFGWIAPNDAQNLGLLDTVAAMTFLTRMLPTFGGAANKITLAGQSSGATMIRALLAAPAASQLFQSAIIESDPMDYGFYTPAIQAEINSDFSSYLNCAGNDSKCLSSLSVQDILDAADNVMYDVQYGAVDPAAGGGEWFRPVRDGSFITSPLDSTATFPKQIKPILVTTVNQEAAYTIYTAYQSPQSIPDYSTDVGYSYSAQSTSHILNSSYYAVPSGVQAEANPDTRPQLQVLGTDGIWRCPAWTFAQAWSKAGGRAYVGEFVVGSTYADNAKAAPCTQAGVVCHQDDIEIVFGTVSNPTSAQAQAITEVQTRIASFVKTGNPNAGSYGTWNQATSSSVNAIQLGNNGASVAVAGCSSGFWGGSVPYDYQVYDL